MDSSRPPAPHQGRHQLAASPPIDNGEGLSAYFSNLTGNPFFTAVRVNPPPHERVCSSTP
jgi:chaperone BCS1